MFEKKKEKSKLYTMYITEKLIVERRKIFNIYFKIKKR